MLSHQKLQALADQRIHVVASDGEKLGTLGQVFLDDATRQPNFISVHAGLFGSTEYIVPVGDTEFSDDQLRVGYTKQVVKGSPNIDPAAPLSATAERELYNYYAQPQATAQNAQDQPSNPRVRTSAPGLGTPLMADELIRQEGAVPEETRMRIIEVTESGGSPQRPVDRAVPGEGNHSHREET